MSNQTGNNGSKITRTTVVLYLLGFTIAFLGIIVLLFLYPPLGPILLVLSTAYVIVDWAIREIKQSKNNRRNNA